MIVGSLAAILGALVAGLFLGVFFGLLGLPIPAPPTFAGIMGIVGVWLGYLIAGNWGG